MTLWGEAKKYTPFLFFAGYLAVYMNKGWNYLVSDLQNISIANFQAKWQSVVMAVVIGVAIYVMHRLKVQPAFKAIIIAALYVALGYVVGTIIDPPSRGVISGQIYRSKLAANPYASH